MRAKALRRIGVVERRFFSRTTRLAVGKVTIEEFERRAGSSAKTVDGLVGIADGEDVSL